MKGFIDVFLSLIALSMGLYFMIHSNFTNFLLCMILAELITIGSRLR